MSMIDLRKHSTITPEGIETAAEAIYEYMKRNNPLLRDFSAWEKAAEPNKRRLRQMADCALRAYISNHH